MASRHGGADPSGEERRPGQLARIDGLRALTRNHVRKFNPTRKDPHWAGANSKGSTMTVFFYVNTSKPARDVDYIKVFANQAAARAALTPTSPRGERGEGE